MIEEQSHLVLEIQVKSHHSFADRVLPHGVRSHALGWGRHAAQLRQPRRTHLWGVGLPSGELLASCLGHIYLLLGGYICMFVHLFIYWLNHLFIYLLILSHKTLKRSFFRSCLGKFWGHIIILFVFWKYLFCTCNRQFLMFSGNLLSCLQQQINLSRLLEIEISFALLQISNAIFLQISLSKMPRTNILISGKWNVSLCHESIFFGQENGMRSRPKSSNTK